MIQYRKLIKEVDEAKGPKEGVAFDNEILIFLEARQDEMKPISLDFN